MEMYLSHLINKFILGQNVKYFNAVFPKYFQLLRKISVTKTTKQIILFIIIFVKTPKI